MLLDYGTTARYSTWSRVNRWGAGNVLSGNGRAGLDMGFAFNDVVEGNLIGINAQGTAVLSNASFGILAAAGSGDTSGLARAFKTSFGAAGLPSGR